MGSHSPSFSLSAAAAWDIPRWQRQPRPTCSCSSCLKGSFPLSLSPGRFSWHGFAHTVPCVQALHAQAAGWAGVTHSSCLSTVLIPRCGSPAAASPSGVNGQGAASDPHTAAHTVGLRQPRALFLPALLTHPFSSKALVPQTHLKVKF